MSQPTVESLVQLLHYCESFAKQMLVTSGEFYPFGAFVNPEGKIEALGGYLGTEHPNSQELYGFLHGAIVQMAREGKLIAYGIAANVNVPQQSDPAFSDGIRVHIEAPEYSRYIYTPYRLLSHQRIRKFLGFVPQVEYADQITVDIEPNVFQPLVG